MMGVQTIPAAIEQKIEAFCGQKKSGRFILDISEGRIVGWEILEKGRIRG
ncbi:MAG TPA: hypothetical protein VEA63_06975 [Opitutus sp.]|nr:hypothetical protein [Opitutus sp.]